MQVTLTNELGVLIKFSTPTMEVSENGHLCFQSDIRSKSRFMLRGATLVEIDNGSDNEFEHNGAWIVKSITNDVAYMWTHNDVYDVYEENYRNGKDVITQEDAENIIETINENDSLNHAVRMTILEEIEYFLRGE